MNKQYSLTKACGILRLWFELASKPCVPKLRVKKLHRMILWVP